MNAEATGSEAAMVTSSFHFRCPFKTLETRGTQRVVQGRSLFSSQKFRYTVGPLQLAITWLDRAMLESKLHSVS